MTDKTLGGYIRTTPHPNDMDGGVAAEQIEQEADTRTREHLLHEESRLLKLEEPLRAHLSRTINRAERAERERDTWKVRAEAAEPARDKWREDAKREQGMSDELARQLEATEASLREANGVVKSLRAAESRPLTPDAITDEMVERARDAFTKHSSVHVTIGPDLVRKTIAAALTEPTRPEGLVALIDTIREATYDPEPVATGEALYSAGVRVVTEEQP